MVVWSDSALVVIEALIILVLGIIVGRWAQRLVFNLMRELEINYLFRRATKIRASLDRFVSLQVAYTIYLITVVFVFSRLGVLSWALWSIAIFCALVVIVSAVLYLINFVPNVWASFLLRSRGLMIGQMLRTKIIDDEIMGLELQYVSLKSGVYIPYFYLWKNKFRVN